MKQKRKNQFQLYIRLSPWIAKRLKYLSEKYGMDNNNIIRVALNDYYKKELTDDDLKKLEEEL